MDVLTASATFLDAANIGIFAAAAVNIGIYKLCKNAENKKTAKADLLKHCKIREAEELLQTSEKVPTPYVGVQGYVATNDIPLQSQFKEDVMGVVKHSVLKEHKSERVNGGVWHDVVKFMKNHTDCIPFGLAGNASNDRMARENFVLLERTQEMEGVSDCSTLTHDKFTPKQGSFWQKGLDRAFGEEIKGYQETEKLLVLGTPVLGLGQLTWRGTHPVLGPPSDSSAGPFILTRLSLDELVASLRRSGRVFRWCGAVFGSLAALLIMWAAYRCLRRLRDQLLVHRLRAQVREAQLRRAARAERPELAAEDVTENTCSVCLSAPSTLIILNCGHLCVCVDCYAALPSPKICPICRGPVARAQPLYRS